MALIAPPANPLKEVFDADTLRRLRSVHKPTDDIRFRLAALEACGPADGWNNGELRIWKAFRAAWEAYIHAAFACGLFQPPKGLGLRRRLQGVNDPNFRAAMSECMACWALSGKLGLPVRPTPEVPGRSADFIVSTPVGDAHVEVKAPRRVSDSKVLWGDNAGTLIEFLKAAEGQLPPTGANILCFVPQLTLDFGWNRNQLIRAFYGEQKIVQPINMAKGGAAGPATLKFFPDGAFLANGQGAGSGPDFREISAVVTIEEVRRSQVSGRREWDWLDHRILVLHNPHALTPLPTTMWKDCPQFLQVDGGMAWSDGRRIMS